MRYLFVSVMILSASACAEAVDETNSICFYEVDYSERALDANSSEEIRMIVEKIVDDIGAGSHVNIPFAFNNRMYMAGDCGYIERAKSNYFGNRYIFKIIDEDYYIEKYEELTSGEYAIDLRDQ